ncbi:hypothetical protein GCM10010167_84300 [Paractinoplanes deccanensis]
MFKNSRSRSPSFVIAILPPGRALTREATMLIVLERGRFVAQPVRVGVVDAYADRPLMGSTAVRGDPGEPSGRAVMVMAGSRRDATPAR